jgi:ribulose-phosphate 3-epimerase
MRINFYPSLISSDLLNLATVMRSLDPHVAGYHLDVMDNHFVPNLTWGAQFINAIVHNTQLPLQVHLMVDDPLSWTEKLQLRSKDFFIFHYEAIAQNSIAELIAALKNKGWRIGIAINPETPIEIIFPYLKALDLALVMSVRPGFSGQKFMPQVLEKILPLQQALAREKSRAEISMDGGINATTIESVVRAGVHNIGLASALFSHKNPTRALIELSELVKNSS